MKKIVKALCLSSALLVSATAQAAWETNWLFGASTGYGERKGDVSTDFFDNATSKGASVSRNLEGRGWLWGILGGYQARCRNLLLGAELAIDWPKRTNAENYLFTDENGDSMRAHSEYKQDMLVALTGRVGYQVLDFFMPYLRAGIETSRDTVKFSANSFNNTLNADIEGRRHVYRFVGGVGAEMPIPFINGLSFRLEYDYHARSRSVEADGVANVNTVSVHTASKQHMNTGKASVVYNFL